MKRFFLAPLLVSSLSTILLFGKDATNTEIYNNTNYPVYVRLVYEAAGDARPGLLRSTQGKNPLSQNHAMDSLQNIELYQDSSYKDTITSAAYYSSFGLGAWGESVWEIYYDNNCIDNIIATQKFGEAYTSLSNDQQIAAKMNEAIIATDYDARRNTIIPQNAEPNKSLVRSCLRIRCLTGDSYQLVVKNTTRNSQRLQFTSTEKKSNPLFGTSNVIEGITNPEYVPIGQSNISMMGSPEFDIVYVCPDRNCDHKLPFSTYEYFDNHPYHVGGGNPSITIMDNPVRNLSDKDKYNAFFGGTDDREYIITGHS